MQAGEKLVKVLLELLGKYLNVFITFFMCENAQEAYRVVILPKASLSGYFMRVSVLFDFDSYAVMLWLESSSPGRFGSFEIFKGPDEYTGRAGPSTGNVDLLAKLTDFAIDTYFPQVQCSAPVTLSLRFFVDFI